MVCVWLISKEKRGTHLCGYLFWPATAVYIKAFHPAQRKQDGGLLYA